MGDQSLPSSSAVVQNILHGLGMNYSSRCSRFPTHSLSEVYRYSIAISMTNIQKTSIYSFQHFRNELLGHTMLFSGIESSSFLPQSNVCRTL